MPGNCLTYTLGNSEMKKGTIIPLTIPEYGLNGTYLITSANHTIDTQNENVDISIREFTI